MTAKAGIIGFTRALAHDSAADGITVNCVVPGLIGTPRPKDKPEPAHHLTHQTISGERGRPEDVAAMVRFLCGPARATSTARPSTPMAGPISAPDAWPARGFRRCLRINALGCAGF